MMEKSAESKAIDRANTAHLIGLGFKVGLTAITTGDLTEIARHLAASGAAILGTTTAPGFLVRAGFVWEWFKSKVGAEKAEAFAATKPGNDILNTIFQRILDAPDDAAMPVLAALVMEYEQTKGTVDRFLRQSSRMVAGCDAEDIALLARIAAVSSEAVGNKGYVKIVRSAGDRDKVNVYADQYGGSSGPTGIGAPVVDADTDRLFYLLGGHGLARTTTFEPSYQPAASARPQRAMPRADGLVMIADYAQRLARILPAPQS